MPLFTNAGKPRPFTAAAPAAVLGLLAVGYVLQLLGLLLGSAATVVAGPVLGLVLEALLLRGRLRRLGRLLARVQLGLPMRQLLRDALLVGGLTRLDALRPEPFAALLLLALLGCWTGHFLCQGVAVLVRRSRTLPFVTRNVDTSGLGLSPAPAPLFGRHGAARLVTVGAVVTAGSAVTAGTQDVRWAALAAAGSWLGLLAGTALLALRLLPGRRPAGEAEALEWLDTWLAAYRPTVGMYFSGGSSSAYQANMWLGPLADLDERPIIVLRERFMVRKLDTTDVPILCVPKVVHLMRLERSTLEVLLHPANSGKSSQVLRIPSIKHAFVNHGESDKLSSCNPYAKAYDEVWVAGPAARERYRLADVGVEDKDVVEVGRPQLTPIRPYGGAPGPGGFTTVLYAPTWEGWSDDPGSTSIILAGENVVRELLADPAVRLLYKPHPMTGSVDPRAGLADRRLRAVIAEANARRGGPRPDPEAVAELCRRAAELDRLTRADCRRGTDEAERMMRQGAPDSGRAATVARAAAAWEEAYWRSLPEGEHQVVTGPRPSLYGCFNQAHLLVSDVSSVVADFLAGEKPYAVVNTSGLDEDGFRAEFPTVRAATILEPDAGGIAALLETVRDPGKDTLLGARVRLREQLLGPAEPPAQVRFGRAVRGLRAEAAARRARCAEADARDAGVQCAGVDGTPDEDEAAAADQVVPAEALDDAP